MTDHPQIAIKSLYIHGVKSIRSQFLDLSNINIVAGANGAGKSNLIFSLKLFLSSLPKDNSLPALVNTHGQAKLLHFGPKVTKTASIIATFSGDMEIIRDVKVTLRLVPDKEQNLLSDISSSIEYESIIPLGDKQSHRVFPSLDKVLNFQIYHFHDTSMFSKMRGTSRVHDTLKLREDASNLAAFLFSLKQHYKKTYEDILSITQRVAPFIQGFILEPQPEDKDSIRLRWQHTDSDDYFDVSDFSDGTLRFLAIVTALLQPDDYMPPLIIIEEPELGLHPFAIHLLAGLIRQASKRTQVIVATQSVTLLNQFTYEDLIITDYKSGETSFRRPDKTEAETWLDDYGLGELWEKNWLGGTP